MDISMTKYTNYLRAVARKKLTSNNQVWVDDIVQETFYKAFKNRDKFDGDKSKLKTWLTTITINLCADYNRKKVNQEVRYDSFSYFQRRYEKESHTISIKVRKYLNKLSYNEQSVIRMKFFFNMTAKEMAPVLGVKPGNIPMMYKRAIEKLRNIMKDNGLDGDTLYS